MITVARALVLFVLVGCAVVSPPPPAAAPPAGVPGAGTIQIVAGTYGGNCGQPPGNVTAHLASSCGGQVECPYRVDHKVIGDPAFGCAKTYVAEWQCAGAPGVRRAEAAAEAGYGSVVQLSCAR
jgi:hypothetical protein